MKYDNLIIDLFNLYYRNYFVFKTLDHKVKGKVLKTGGIYGTIKSIKSLVNKHLKEDGKIYLASDNFSAKVQMRKEINPTYKANRDKQPAEFYRGIEYLMLILLNYSDKFFIVQKTGVEADDFVPALLDSFEKNKSTLLVSTDLDWSRCIDYKNTNTHWSNGKDIIDKIEFEKRYNFRPSNEKICLYKTIRGDKVDNIHPGVPRLPEKLLLELIEYGDFYKILNDLPYLDFLPDKWKEQIKINESKLRLNYQMVSFIDIDEKNIKNCIFKGKYKPMILKILYKSLGFAESFDSRVYEEEVDEDEFSKYFTKPKIMRV